jgi:ferrous iron transport protein A
MVEITSTGGFNMKLCLGELTPGETGKVVGYKKGTLAYRERLLSMGLTRGAEFTVERVAPLGDPVEITVRGFALSLRKDEAGAVLVEKEGRA